MKHKNAGFTITELMIVIAVVAILSAIAVPNIFSWRERAKFHGAYENLRGDLRLAKARAIREYATVSVVFYADPQRYEIFVDNGAGGVTAGDYNRGASEPLLRSRQLPAGIAIDPAAPNIDRTQFDRRGRCPADGEFLMQSTVGDQKIISINPLGQISVEEVP